VVTPAVCEVQQWSVSVAVSTCLHKRESKLRVRVATLLTAKFTVRYYKRVIHESVREATYTQVSELCACVCMCVEEDFMDNMGEGS
jgi:hypothetical protein